MDQNFEQLKKERDEAILRAESLEQQKKELEVKLAQLSLEKKTEILSVSYLSKLKIIRNLHKEPNLVEEFK